MPAIAPRSADRNPGLDALKGLLMIAVIAGHFPRNRYGVSAFGLLSEGIYFIHVPLFLALSCLFVKAGGAGARALRILVPYLAWGLLEHPLGFLHAPGAWAGSMALGTWASLRSTLWFLPVLLTSNLLAGAWAWSLAPGPRARVPARRALALGLGAASGAVILGAHALAPFHPFVPFGLDVALFLLPFNLVIRALWARRERLRAWWPLALAALPAGAFLLRSLEAVKTHSPFARRVDFAQFSVPETLGGHLGMGLMGAALVVLAVRFRPPAWLARVGRSTLPIYLMHYPLLFLLTRTIDCTGASLPGLFLYALAVTAATVALPMVLAGGLSRLWPGFRWVGLGQCSVREVP